MHDENLRRNIFTEEKYQTHTGDLVTMIVGGRLGSIVIFLFTILDRRGRGSGPIIPPPIRSRAPAPFAVGRTAPSPSFSIHFPWNLAIITVTLAVPVSVPVTLPVTIYSVPG